MADRPPRSKWPCERTYCVAGCPKDGLLLYVYHLLHNNNTISYHLRTTYRNLIPCTNRLLSPDITMAAQNELNFFTGEPLSTNARAVRCQARALPVSQEIPFVVHTVHGYVVRIIVGETSSGKKTQIPMHILKADLEMSKKGGKKLVVSQNRRLAADLVRSYFSLRCTRRVIC